MACKESECGPIPVARPALPFSPIQPAVTGTDIVFDPSGSVVNWTLTTNTIVAPGDYDGANGAWALVNFIQDAGGDNTVQLPSTFHILMGPDPIVGTNAIPLDYTGSATTRVWFRMIDNTPGSQVIHVFVDPVPATSTDITDGDSTSPKRFTPALVRKAAGPPPKRESSLGTSIDANNGIVQSRTISGAVTFTASNFEIGDSVLLILSVSGGPSEPTWPTTTTGIGGGSWDSAATNYCELRKVDTNDYVVSITQ